MPWRRRFASACSKPPRIVLNRLFIAARFCSSRLSKPISTPMQPLRASRSRNSSSWAALMLAWLTQRIFSGISARKNAFACSMLLGDVVVDEEEQLRPKSRRTRSISRDDLVDRPARLRRVEDGLHGAELALEVAPAAGLDQADRQVALAAEDRAVGPQRREVGPAVGRGRTSAACRGGSRRSPSAQTVSASPTTTASAYSRHFVRAERRVKAAHHDRHAAAAVFAGDLVRALGGVRLDADRDEVGRLVEGDRLHPVVVEADVDVGRRQPGDRSRRAAAPSATCGCTSAPAGGRCRGG